MARLIAMADGNFTSSGTWYVADANTALVTEGGTSRTALTTSSQNSANFTPNANITIDAIAIKVADVQGATGNLTLNLYNVTSTASVVSLTIPIADLPQGSANTTGYRAGWVLFATGDQNLTSGSNYQIRLNVSSGSSTVGVMTNGTAANWQHMLRTKTAAAPASGDDLWVLGLWTASGTWTQYTVVMDSTSTATTYGSNPSGGTQEEHNGLWIGKSTVNYGTTASTAYALKIAGRVSVGPAGVLSLGTSGTPMPATSTAQLMFATTNAVHGLTVFNGGTVYTYGASKTKNWTTLTADASSGSTASVSVADDTGWTSGSTCYLSATSQTYSQAAQYTLSGAASTASMAFTGALSATYLGSGPGSYPWPCHLVLTSYNVEITSDVSTRYNTHIVYGTGLHTGSWFKFTYGIYELNAVTSNMNLQYWCIDFQATNPAAVVAFIVNGVCSGTWTISNLVGATNIAAYFATIIPNNSSTVTSMTFDSIVVVGDGTGCQGFQVIWGPFAQVKKLRALGGTARLDGSTWGSTIVPPSDWLESSWVHGSTSQCLSVPASAGNTTITDFRGQTTAAGTACISAPNPNPNIKFVQCYFIGGAWLFTGGTSSKLTDWVFDRCYIGGLTTYSQSMSAILSLFSSLTSICHIKFLGCVFDNAWLDGPTASLVDLVGTGTSDDPTDLRVSFVNCAGNPTTGLVCSTTPAYTTKESFVSVNKWNQTSGDHRVYKPFALNASTASSFPCLQTDAATFNTAAPSEKMTPKSASLKLESSVKRVAVASGATAYITVYVRKSAAYNGNAPRLILKRNDSAGTTADTVGATHTAAADTWEQLTYTTPAAADDCVMEFVVDCDGTAGVVYVDDWAAT